MCPRTMRIRFGNTDTGDLTSPETQLLTEPNYLGIISKTKQGKL